MKFFFYTLISIIFIFLTSLMIILSTTGIKTDRFNNLISKKINQANNNVNLKLTTIKFKIDIKKIDLFLETINPQISYREINIPAQNIKVYTDFISLLKSELRIKKINLSLNELDIRQLKKLSFALKPSNFTSFIINKVAAGKVNVKLDVYLNDNNLLENFIAQGSVSSLKAEIKDNINLSDVNFSFFADKTDILIQNIIGKTGPINITEGDLKLQLLPEILLESNFKTILKYNNRSTNFSKLINNFKYAKNIVNLDADLNNSFLINFDKTYGIKNYNYKSNGKIINANLNLKKPIENDFLSEKINQLTLINSEINTNFNLKKNNTNIVGKYSLNKGNFLPFNLQNIIERETLKLKLDVDYDKLVELAIFNYKKPKDSIANISIDLSKKKNY